MDAIKTLRDDHKTVRGLFAQLDTVDARAPEMKLGVVRQLVMELKIHSSLERELFYPAAESLGDTEIVGLVASCRGAHDELDTLLSTLAGTDDDELHALITSVDEHMIEEEQTLFPLIESRMGDKLEALGARISERRKQLLASPEYRDSLPERTQNPNGGEQARKIA